jgi:hypothetical protein
METENAFHTIQGQVDALTLVVAQLLGELTEQHRKFLS